MTAQLTVKGEMFFKILSAAAMVLIILFFGGNRWGTPNEHDNYAVYRNNKEKGSNLMALSQDGLANANANSATLRIGIIGAMKSEVEELKRAAKVKEPFVCGGREFFVGELDGVEVIIAECGIGKVNAALCASVMTVKCGVSHIINTGVAGSLNNALNIGDIVVSVDAVQHDYDVSYIGFRKGEIPFTGKYAFEADSVMRKIALETAKEILPDVGVIEGRIASGDQFIASKAQKTKIVNDFSADCAEMLFVANAFRHFACHFR